MSFQSSEIPWYTMAEKKGTCEIKCHNNLHQLSLLETFTYLSPILKVISYIGALFCYSYDLTLGQEQTEN